MDHQVFYKNYAAKKQMQPPYLKTGTLQHVHLLYLSLDNKLIILKKRMIICCGYERVKSVQIVLNWAAYFNKAMQNDE